ncbi:MAG: cupin domain-containing protein [Rudaea sp.]
MAGRLFCAADIRACKERGETRIELKPDDIVTAEAADVAASLGVRLLQEGQGSAASRSSEASGAQRAGPRVRLVRGSKVPLEPFAFDVKRPEMNIRTTDVITDRDGSPMGAGLMTFEQGAFPWTLNYDEIDFVIEGELVIRVGEESYSGHAGDIIYIPKGTSIEFCTPTRCRFLYVTFPANWSG